MKSKETNKLKWHCKWNKQSNTSFCFDRNVFWKTDLFS